MPTPRTKPSKTSIAAFVMIVTPVVYVLSYAPVVKVCGRTTETPSTFRPTNQYLAGDFRGTRPWPFRSPVADRSLYPAYGPVDWMIDHTPLREPLFVWAGVWGVREDFELGVALRENRQFMEDHGLNTMWITP